MRPSRVLSGVVAALVSLVLCACQPKAPAGPEAAFGSKAPSSHAFEGTIYYLADGTPKLPDLKTLPPHGKIYVRELNVPNQDFSLGFPGVTDRTTWFAIDYKGAFTVAQPGKYNFHLASDDGSKLWIDGKVAVDDDGVHGVTSASGDIDLAAGRHAIEVQYFQGPPTAVALQLFCTAPGGKEAIFPACGLNLDRPGQTPWLWWLLALLVIAALILLWLNRERLRPRPAPQTSA